MAVLPTGAFPDARTTQLDPIACYFILGMNPIVALDEARALPLPFEWESDQDVGSERKAAVGF